MNRILNILMGSVLVATLAQEASAQWNVARFNSTPNRAYTMFGLDPSLVTTVGYARVLPIMGHNVQLYGDGALAGGKLDTHDFRARLGAQSSIVRWRSVQLVGSATFLTRGTSNTTYDGLNFGADFTGSLGVYRQSWFSAAEFGFDKAIVTHITHSDWYRNNYYADAKDGWYMTGGGTFHYGFAAGVPLGRIEVSARAGWVQTEDFNDLTPPMYGSLGVGFGF